MSKYKCIHDLNRPCIAIPQGTLCNENCFKGYQQGRADAKKEFENEMQMLCKNYIEGAREQGIADERERIISEIKKWYWDSDKQRLADDPCVVDAMIDLFIRTVRGGENE